MPIPGNNLRDNLFMTPATNPTEYPTRLDLCDGKYTVIYDLNKGQSECLRYGEKWRDLRGDKMTLAMFDRIVELQIKVAEAESSERVAHNLLANRLIECDQLRKDVTLLRVVLSSYDGSHSIDQWDENIMPTRAWDKKRIEALAATEQQS